MDLVIMLNTSFACQSEKDMSSSALRTCEKSLETMDPMKQKRIRWIIEGAVIPATSSQDMSEFERLEANNHNYKVRYLKMIQYVCFECYILPW